MRASIPPARNLEARSHLGKQPQYATRRALAGALALSWSLACSSSVASASGTPAATSAAPPAAACDRFMSTCSAVRTAECTAALCKRTALRAKLRTHSATRGTVAARPPNGTRSAAAAALLPAWPAVARSRQQSAVLAYLRGGALSAAHARGRLTYKKECKTATSALC